MKCFTVLLGLDTNGPTGTSDIVVASGSMPKVIVNRWKRAARDAFERAVILNRETAPEGLDVERLRFVAEGPFLPSPHFGHVVSMMRGTATLHVRSEPSLKLVSGCHVYLPPDLECRLDGVVGTELVHVWAPESQARGKSFLLRDEAFLSACANDSLSFRWVLTPQYLSRRVFLSHDSILTSKSGNPVSWFHTTMFDGAGLPVNADGESVFKMSYNSQTEFNVCYDVCGSARVRMALHPYGDCHRNGWGPWLGIDDQTTYHLDEGTAEEELCLDPDANVVRSLRNRHEVSIAGDGGDGAVSLFCLFDPAPTGRERHRVGEYSSYSPPPPNGVIDADGYGSFLRELEPYDEMVDQLSRAKAVDELRHRTPAWNLYSRGRAAQLTIERRLLEQVASEGNGRDRIIAPWIYRNSWDAVEDTIRALPKRSLG